MVTAAPMIGSMSDPRKLLLVGTRDASAGNAFRAFNWASGASAWTFNNGGGSNGIGIVSAPAYVDWTWNGQPGEKRAFFASRARSGGSPNTVWAVHFNATSAHLEWATGLPGDIDGAPTAGPNGAVIVGTNAGEVWAFDPTGASPNPVELWHRGGFGGAIKEFVSYDRPRNRLLFTAGDTVWSIPADGSTGNDWSVSLPGRGPSRPLAVFGTPYVLVGACATSSCSDGQVLQFNSSEATPWSTTTVAGNLAGSGSPGGVTVVLTTPKMAFVGSGSGRVYAVQLSY
jgi:hypothetical protein